MSASDPSPAERGTARTRLLAATAELTYAGSIGSTGVDAIAKRAGVTKRTLYQHFASKAELVAASLTWRDGPAIAALRASSLRVAERKGVPPVLALFDVIGSTVAGVGQRGCAFLNAALELETRDHPAVHSALHHLDARRALIGELVAASGIDSDPGLIDELVLLVDGSFAVAASRRDPTAARHARRAASRLVEHYQSHQAPKSAPRARRRRETK